MNLADHTAAGNALIAWFQSQDIMPADAGMIMSKVIAGQLVNKSRDIRALQEAATIYQTLLYLDIVDCLNAHPR